jgi:hypothetical protein
LGKGKGQDAGFGYGKGKGEQASRSDRKQTALLSALRNQGASRRSEKAQLPIPNYQTGFLTLT